MDLDAHYAEVIYVESTLDRPRYYVARCKCGWIGGHRPTRFAADEDASAHHLAMYPGDQPGSVYR